MASRSVGRSLDQKVGDWKSAYDAIKVELTPPGWKEELKAHINQELPGDSDVVTAFIARTNATMALARLLAANDRAAGTIAALITQTGIKPAAVDYGDDT